MKPKSIRFAAWLLGSLCVLATSGCAHEKEGPTPELVAVRYTQIQCGEPWSQVYGAQPLVASAQAYLAQQGITLHHPQAHVIQAGGVCQACGCPTGVVLEGAVQPADVTAVLALGFTKQ